MNTNFKNMRMPLGKLVALGVLVLAGLGLIGPTAVAQQWPTRPIKIIVPVPPGQGADIIARFIAEHLAVALGQPVIVDNKPGAGTMLGSEAAAKSPADGYTFLAAGSSALVINPHLYAKMAYDPLKDFAPITQLVSIDFILVVHPSLPVRNVADLIKLARERPYGLTYGSTGNGTTNHLAMALFAAQNNIKLTHVPYKGSVPAMTDLVGGQISMIAESVAVVRPHIQSNRVRPIGATALKRSAIFPDVPTLDEQGVKEFAVSTWTGLVAPSGTPAAILDRMSTEVDKILRRPEAQLRIRDLGMSPVGGSPQQFNAYINAEYAKWAEAVKISGAKVE